MESSRLKFREATVGSVEIGIEDSERSSQVFLRVKMFWSQYYTNDRLLLESSRKVDLFRWRRTKTFDPIQGRCSFPAL